MLKKEEKRVKSFAVSVVKGAVFGTLSVLVLLALFSVFISSGKIPEGFSVMSVLISSGLGALIGSVTAIRNYRARLLTTGLAVSGAMFLLTLLGSAFSEDGALISGITPALFAVLIAGGVLGSFLCVKKKRRKHT